MTGTDMTGTTIDPGQPVATLINVFSVRPEAQQELVELLVDATEQVMRHRPGFVSANVHASLDGTRVVNYAQWRDREAFELMLGDATAQEHMSAVWAIASAEPRLYDVVSVHHAETADAPPDARAS